MPELVWRYACCLIALVLPLALEPAASQPAASAQATPRGDDVRKLRALLERESLEPQTAISPDGTQVAYLRSRDRLEDDRVHTELWLVPATGGEHQRIVAAEHRAARAAWSPDGRWLTYLSARGRAPQIYAWSLDTQREVELTAVAMGVTNYTWSPDGTRIAFIGQAPVPDAIRQRHERFSAYRVVGEPTPGTQLLTVDVGLSLKAPQAGTLRAEDYSIEGWLAPVAWSPDGTSIAFSGRPRKERAREPDIYVVDLATGRTRAIVTQKGRDRDPLWSPDGQQVAFLSDMARSGLAGWHYEIAVAPTTGGVLPRSVSSAFDNLPRPIAWLPSGIYFQGSRGVTSHLFRTDLDGRIVRASAPDALMAQGFSVSRTGSHIAFIAAEIDSVDELYVSDASPFTPRALTSQRESVDRAGVGRRQLITWKNPRDGETVEGVLITPGDFDPSKKYPLLVVVHGGPQEVDRPVQGGNRIYPVDLWAAKGAIVLRPNYRGSGYSKRWRSLAYRGFPAQVEDIAAGVAHLKGQGLVDATRVGCMGWSHGGYVVAMLATSTDLCTAASVGAATADWNSSYYGSRKVLADAYFGASPLDEPDLYRRASIAPFLKHARTPTLIQHGEQDQGMPVSAGYSLRQMLSDAGVKTEMIVYVGAGHNPGTPKRLLTATLHNLWWFNHYIFGEPAPDFVTPLDGG